MHTIRLVNGYSERDWMLAFVFRSSTFRRFVAGLQEVQVINPHNRVLQNMNLTGSHTYIHAYLCIFMFIKPSWRVGKMQFPLESVY